MPWMDAAYILILLITVILLLDRLWFGCEQICSFIGATLGDNKLYFHIGVAITAAAAVAWRAREHRPDALAILNMNRYKLQCML